MRIFDATFWDLKKQYIAFGAVAVLAVVAVVVSALGGQRFILLLTPFYLSILAALSLMIWEISVRKKLVMAALVILVGYLIELIGIKTGIIFGSYYYGTLMGFKLAGVPIIIGITWLVVTLSSWHIAGFGVISKAQKIILASFLAVTFDIILEQFAIVYGFWVWRAGAVPILNYITWFIVSALFLSMYSYFDKKPIPSLFIAFLLPLMAAFFWIMLIIA